ncbi:NAD(P)/FAD-dependent oxidoreductase [Ruminococcus albus]|uniref:FAD-dependent pyridine nucleotide-disulfide oxidoreductase n=1 Tax=Ruminococcus albus (strain ATCC 27210 / DSM 20455 / JCM 14654 / NCDO 2250 / 7) TaxID=697329 RepID=E6UKJ8_RUMA7|nr:FAD-dependent oxidoreductase [Ruminococcus albus]ADU24194.1 FAD-dependent pyridine nucleotide-disulfide oxidoreductase [Ruminococcus albus 7 = DSM 20455]
MREFDIVIVGGGPAGMAAAVSARENGMENIIIFERDSELGGILNQCIHNGFGLHTFKEELTGPEYAERYAEMVRAMNIPYETDTMVLDISKDRVVTVMSRKRGVEEIRAKAVILAMGCRERPRGALNIPGFRPQGVYTAGTAQKLVNCEGYVPGKEVVILGSGDIGLIMARRMTLEGAHVAAVAELMPYSSGLKRNIVQCLEDYGIPLLLSHTVVDIKGKEKLEGVVIAEVDGKNTPIPGTEKLYPCDTLLLSCGLIPENELSKNCGVGIDPRTNGPVVDEGLETDIDGVFACGNVLHVHDLVDFVSEESARAGASAAAFVKRGCTADSTAAVKVIPQNGVRYTVPAEIHTSELLGDVHIRFRVTGVFKDRSIVIKAGDEELIRRKSRILVPSEMLDIIIKKEKLEGVNCDITAAIEEV